MNFYPGYAETHDVYRANAPIENDGPDRVDVHNLDSEPAAVAAAPAPPEAGEGAIARLPVGLRTLLRAARDRLHYHYANLSLYLGGLGFTKAFAVDPGYAYSAPPTPEPEDDTSLAATQGSEPSVRGYVVDSHTSIADAETAPDDYEDTLHPEAGELPPIAGIYAQGSGNELPYIISVSDVTDMIVSSAAAHLAQQAMALALHSSESIDLGFSEEQELAFTEACRTAHSEIVAMWSGEPGTEPLTLVEVIRRRRSVVRYNQVEQAAMTAYRAGRLYIELKPESVARLDQINQDETAAAAAQQRAQTEKRVAVERHNVIASSIQTAAIMNDSQIRALALDYQGLGDMQGVSRDEGWARLNMRREFMDGVARLMHADPRIGIRQATRDVYERMKEVYGPGTLEDARIRNLLTTYRRLYPAAQLPAA